MAALPACTCVARARLEPRIDLLKRTLLERCWHAEDRFFYDLTPEGEPTRVKTFFGFLPLWVGLEMPDTDRKALIEEHLLNPVEFFGDVPFPSVAYNEPEYSPVGYWRGRCWPHIYFWMTETLAGHGYLAEAERACAVFLELIARWRAPMENFPSQLASMHDERIPNYIWGAAALLLFLQGAHRKPVFANLADLR